MYIYIYPTLLIHLKNKTFYILLACHIQINVTRSFIRNVNVCKHHLLVLNLFQALDFVVSEAKKYKIRLVLSLTNNWEGYGGKAQYVKWGKEAGLNLTSDDDFFSDPTVKGYYQAHIKVNLFSFLLFKVSVAFCELK